METKLRSIKDEHGNDKYFIVGRKIEEQWMISEPLNNMSGVLIDLLTGAELGTADNLDQIASEHFVDSVDDPEVWESQ